MNDPNWQTPNGNSNTHTPTGSAPDHQTLQRPQRLPVSLHSFPAEPAWFPAASAAAAAAFTIPARRNNGPGSQITSNED